MKCPRDGNALVQRRRDGVDIDYCPECRGVWLDRGELDKIIAETLGTGTRTERYHREHDDRAGFIGELFDF